VFTARYALSPYIKQIRFVFKGLKPEGMEEVEAADYLSYLSGGGTLISDGIRYQGWAGEPIKRAYL
jgi:hypothetical protein